MQEMSKLQIRAKILSVFSEIKTSKLLNAEALKKYVQDLSCIEDKAAFFDIAIKEYVKLDEELCLFCSCLFKELISKDIIEDKVFEYLKQPSYSDEHKYKLVQMLRIVGYSDTFSELPEYFENPQEVLDKETQRLLDKATFNPETMLDFLDFIYTVADKDKILLLKSLKNDYQGDNLANLVYPILYSDFNDDLKLQVVEVLSESKSSISIEPLNYLKRTTDNKEILSVVEIGLKKLKLSGATQEKADEYFKSIISNSTPSEFYTTIPDGAGNQALLISRINDNNNVNFAAVVINDRVGVVDCFGFYNISQDETARVIAKFYKSEGKYEVLPQYVKTRILQAMKINEFVNRPFPYEFICWSALLKDIPELPIGIHEFVDNLDVELKLEKDYVPSVLTKEYTFRWFINPEQNLPLKNLIKELYNLEEFEDNETINSIVRASVSKIFDFDEKKIWVERLYQLIYLLTHNNQSEDAYKFLHILKDDACFDLFSQIIIQRSIFNNFVLINENSKETAFTVNIFKKKVVEKQGYDLDKVSKIISFLRKSWFNE